MARISVSSLVLKSELEAGDLNVARSPMPRSELQNYTAVPRAALPPEVSAKNVANTIEERGRRRERSPPHAEVISELASTMPASTSQPARFQLLLPVVRGSEQAATDMSRSTNAHISFATLQPSSDSYSAAEADLTVQELGLVGMRKRKLAEQAAAAGKAPNETGGRAQEQYEELMERESKLRRLLEDMQGSS